MIKFILIIFLQMNLATASLAKDQTEKRKKQWIDYQLLSDLAFITIEEIKQVYNKAFFQPSRKIALTQKTEKTNKNKIDKNLSIELESSFTAKKNDLLLEDYSWKYYIPYIDTSINYQISKNLLFETEFELSYQDNQWNYFLEEFFLTYKWAYFLLTDFTVGYLEYPMSDNLSDENFSKDSLLEKNLFPVNDSDIGVLVKTNFWKFLYLQVSWQTWTGVREILKPLNRIENTWSSNLIFEQNSKYIFASYIKQNFFSKKQKQAFGLGSHISYPIYSFLLSFKAEHWKIEQAIQNTTVYYIMPAIQWERLAFTFLTGKAYYQQRNLKSESRESILKTDFYLTDELFITLERFTERDTIIKSSFWGLSIRSEFKL